MKKWTLPSILDFNDLQDYFRKLLEMNKEVRGFSQRNLSLKLGWPVSFLPDFLKGRKAFTVQRALEFMELFPMEPLSREKLILLAVSNQIPEARDKILPAIRSKNSKRKDKTSDWDLLDMNVYLVLECVRWLGNDATIAMISALLKRHGVSEKTVSDKIELLMEKKVLKKVQNRYEPLVKTFFTEDFGYFDDIAFHKESAENLKRFLDSRFGPALYNSILIQLPIHQFDELADKIAALRNWIFHQAENFGETPLADRPAGQVFQLDLNLFPLFKKSDLES